MTDNTTRAVNEALDLYAERRRRNAVHGGAEFTEGYEETMREVDRDTVMSLVHMGLLKPSDDGSGPLTEAQRVRVQEMWLNRLIEARGDKKPGRGWLRRISGIVADDTDLLGSANLLRDPFSLPHAGGEKGTAQ